MGVDASIFAEKAKRYFYFDRAYNFRNEGRQGLNAYEATELAKASIEYWKQHTDDSAHRVAWNEGIIKFVECFPDSRFFVVTDADEPPWHDYAEMHNYKEWNSSLFPRWSP